MHTFRTFALHSIECACMRARTRAQVDSKGILCEVVT